MRGRSYSDDLIEVRVPLGRLVYMGSASSGTELRMDEKKGWVQSGNKRKSAGGLKLNPLAALQRCTDWSRQRPIALALLSLAIGGGIASGLFLLQSQPQSHVAAVPLLPPPLPEEPIAAEDLEAVPHAYAELNESAASAVNLPVTPNTAAVAQAATAPTAAPVPALAPQAVVVANNAPVAPAPVKAAPKPPAAPPAPTKEASTAPVFDAGPQAAPAAAPAAVPPKVERRAAAEAPRGTKLLLAVPSKDWVVVADAASGLPKQYRVGDKLPTGAVILSADPKAGTVVTDRGPINLE